MFSHNVLITSQIQLIPVTLKPGKSIREEVREILLNLGLGV